MMIKALLLSMVVASVSFFISHTPLLTKQRRWLWDHSEFFGELVECSYCLGHWVAAIAMIYFPTRLFGVFWPVDYFMTWLVISWVAGLQSLAASWLVGD